MGSPSPHLGRLPGGEAAAVSRDPGAPIGIFDRLSSLGDERLARLVARGQARAFSILYLRYHAPLYRYCRSLLLNDADAQDALQGTFARALEELRAAPPDMPLRPWLFRLAHEETSSSLLRTCELDELGIARLEAAPEERAEGRARLARLVADMLDLPTRQRAALAMRELSGLSHDDIAAALGITTQATSHAIYEARRSLADCELGRQMHCDEVCRLISDNDGKTWRLRRIRAHLRDCVSCRAFAGDIHARRSELRAIAPPLTLPLALALLRRAARAASATGGGSATSVGVAAGGTAAAIGLSGKALSLLAVVAMVAPGTGAIVRARNGAAVARAPGVRVHAERPVRAERAMRRGRPGPNRREPHQIALRVAQAHGLAPTSPATTATIGAGPTVLTRTGIQSQSSMGIARESARSAEPDKRATAASAEPLAGSAQPQNAGEAQKSTGVPPVPPTPPEQRGRHEGHEPRERAIQRESESVVETNGLRDGDEHSGQGEGTAGAEAGKRPSTHGALASAQGGKPADEASSGSSGHREAPDIAEGAEGVEPGSKDVPEPRTSNQV